MTSTHQVLPPAREMTDFEQHVYECTYMIGKKAADVVRTPAQTPKVRSGHGMSTY